MHPFPRAKEIKIAEFLNQMHRLVNDAALRVIITNLDMAGQREILAKRMPLKTIIGQKAAQIRMAGKENAEHVPNFAFSPIRRHEHAGY